jgi:hypothetical protein
MHMDFHGPAFVLSIIALSLAGWLINNWIRAKHGYSVSDDWGRNISKTDLDADKKIGLLASENGRLTDMVTRLEERIAVLERIATDRGSRLSDEIERLR